MFRIVIFIAFFIFSLEAKSINFSMVISGGISLGAYESGYNWAIINLLKKIKYHSKVNPNLNSSAGASAGAINTLLSAIYWCLEKDYKNRVDDNLFFNTWTEIDIKDLLIKGYNPQNNSTLFSRDILDKKANNILNFMQKNIFKKECSIPIGFMLTKATPITEKFDGIKMKIQSFEVALKLYEKDKKLYLKNIDLKEPYKEFLHQIYIPEVENNIAYIKKILFASSAFPMAFSQVKLKYIYKGKRREDWFLDGGVYNNIPLDLSLALNPNSNYFLFIDPDNKRDFNPKNLKYCKKRVKIKRTFNQTTNIEENLDKSGFFANNLSPLFRSVSIFRSLKLYETINRYFKMHPDKKIILSSRYHPITGYFVEAFGAFLDKNFSEYDYYVGVYDAIYQLSKKAIENGFSNSNDLKQQMLIYKKYLNIEKNSDAEEVFNILMDVEFCQSKIKVNNRFAAIYKSFEATNRYKDKYSLKAFSAFLKTLKKYKKYLNLNNNSFLTNALNYPDSWYKDITSNIVDRIVFLEKQRAKEDKSYEAIAKVVSFSAWISRSYLSKRKGLIFQPLLPQSIKDNKNNFIYRLIPSEFAIDTINGGFSIAYSLYWYKKWAIFEGIETKLSINHSKHIDDNIRLDIDPFIKLKKSLYLGGGVSLFGNLEHRAFWDRKSAFGVNIYMDYNNIFRFTYIRRFNNRNKYYLYFGIENLGTLFYYFK